MKRFKDFALGVLVFAGIGFLIYNLLQYDHKRTNRELARQIANLSPRGGPPDTVESLRQTITLYEAQIERNVSESAQTGVYWKILATRFADTGMHNDALAALERSIYYNAEDPVLFYLTGVSAGMVAKSHVGFSGTTVRDREHYFELSENAYLRALELDSSYTRPMYGLGILYAFELDRPADAIVYLEELLSYHPSDIHALFVLARAYYMTGQSRRAIEIYDRIISSTRDRKIREDALNNIEIIQRQML